MGHGKGSRWKLPPQQRNLVGCLLLAKVRVKDIVQLTGVSQPTVVRISQNLKTYGQVDCPIQRPRGRPAELTKPMLIHLVQYLTDKPTAYLDEMMWFIWDVYEVETTVSALSRALSRFGWTRKVTQRRALEASEEKRRLWEIIRDPWTQGELVFVDESGAHERTGDRKYGWAPVGQSPLQISRFHREERWSILPALAIDGFVGEPLIYHGSINGDRFAAWLEVSVLPFCNPYADGEKREKSILVLDNAKIHKTKAVQDVLEASGVLVAFLPPYSPDYNPIELQFAVLKAYIRRNGHIAPSFENYGVFLVWICSLFGGKDAVAHFRHCGYMRE